MPMSTKECNECLLNGLDNCEKCPHRKKLSLRRIPKHPFTPPTCNEGELIIPIRNIIPEEPEIICKTGPTGPTGPSGGTGETGNTGPTGPTGTSR